VWRDHFCPELDDLKAGGNTAEEGWDVMDKVSVSCVRPKSKRGELESGICTVWICTSPPMGGHASTQAALVHRPCILRAPMTA
jgi:hypothetical protein